MSTRIKELVSGEGPSSTFVGHPSNVTSITFRRWTSFALASLVLLSWSPVAGLVDSTKSTNAWVSLCLLQCQVPLLTYKGFWTEYLPPPSNLSHVHTSARHSFSIWAYLTSVSVSVLLQKSTRQSSDLASEPANSITTSICTNNSCILRIIEC